MISSLSVGVAQWLAVPGDADTNLRTALLLIEEAKQQGAQLMVLPELWLCGYDPTTLADDARKAAVSPGHRLLEILGETASRNRMWLAAGSVPERDGGKLYDTCFVFSPSGELRARHRKAHLYPPTGETAIFAAGEQITTFKDRTIGTVGVVVCFDGDFPEVGVAMARRGVNLVLAPCAYEVEGSPWWDLVYPAAALANGQWWVQANQCGRISTGTLLGGSRIIAPAGTIVTEAARALPGTTPPSEVLVRRIDPGISNGDPTSALVLAGRRPELYGED